MNSNLKASGFSGLGLIAPLMRAVEEKGYETPSPIQEEAIPAVLGGRDVMAAAQTGTGKTAGFTLPILQLLHEAGRAPGKFRPLRALIVTPTRELAAQVEASVKTYGEYLPLRSAVVFGGVKINPQINTLRNGVDILVATPGRLLDLHQQGIVSFQELEILVLDEADRMLDMGFIHDIRKILALLPPQRQNLLFSATFSSEIRALAKGLVNSPLEISVTPPNSTVDTVSQTVLPVDKRRKADLLIHLIKERQWHQVLVFTRTKHGANRLAQKLEKSGIESAAIHGNKSQNARTRALAGFKSNQLQVLVATDIAARGLDINQLPQVVNFDLPNVEEDYVHRIGRTGRAGAQGKALSLVCLEESKLLRNIERFIHRNIDVEQIPGFEPMDPPSSLQEEGPRRSAPMPRGNGRRQGGQGRGRNPGSTSRSHRGGQASSGGSNRSRNSRGSHRR
ncbi:MAG: DEAD/DEAH box helicase [Spirochaetales bacterium]|nr:DEAD/DEAH box helicase [Spirochaetales bacterium]